MLSVAEISALGEVDPEFEKILNSNEGVLPGWTMDTDIHQIRAIIAKMRLSQPKPDPASLPYTEEDLQIPVRNGRQTGARVYKPRDVSDHTGLPGFVVFHGGGYAIGDFETEAWLCALFTSLGGIAVNVDYRHAPEHVFPAAVEDAFDATRWVAQNTQSLGIDPAKGLLVGGESAGADLSLVVAHLCANEDVVAPLTGVYAGIPAGVNEQTLPGKYKDVFLSKIQNAEAPLLSTESVKFVYSIYKPDQKSPMAFPIAFPDHSRVPKTYFQVCGMDPVRDCGLVLEQELKEANVPTKLDIYPGLPHGFWAIYPQLSSAKKQKEDAREGLKWLLSK